MAKSGKTREEGKYSFVAGRVLYLVMEDCEFRMENFELSMVNGLMKE